MPEFKERCINLKTHLHEGIGHLLHLILICALTLFLILVDLLNGSVNVIVQFVPLSLVCNPERLEVGGDEIPPEASLGAISSWLFVF